MLSDCCGGGSVSTTPAARPENVPKFKVIMLGDWGCGKTCLLARFAENAFPDLNSSSQDLNMSVKSVDVSVGREPVKLILWDTGGQEKFRCLTTSYYRDATAVILVYDITNRLSFENIEHWRRQVALYAPTVDITLLIGTKVDAAAEERRVTAEEGQMMAESMRAQFAETSSKEGTNTGVCLSWLAAKCLHKFRSQD